ncbi:ATP-grasp domain-containing protein [Acidimicrobiaceae bacterium]|nr:ATP-grasp domain-containing protein [Acidimicrobiaceae bacterium]
MKKLLLVIPENSYKSNDFVTSAEKLDLDFLVITDSQQVSSQFSDTVIIHSFDKELENDVKEKLQDVTHILPVDHSALKFSAYLVDLLNAKGNNTKSINTAMNKFESRKIFNSISEIKIQNAIVKKIEDIEIFINENGTSVLKPIYGTASKSVIKVESFQENRTAVEKLMQDCSDQDLIIEEFVDGSEYALEGNLINSELNKIVIFDKPINYKEPYFEESIYIAPTEIPDKTQKEIVNLIGKACKKLGLENGPVHVEFKIHNNEIFIIEINPRMIGGLCSRCLSFGLFKTSLEEIALHAFLNNELKSIDLLSNFVGVLMIPTPISGKFISINKNELESIPNVSGVEITVSENSNLLEPPFGDKYLGFVFSQGDSKEKVMESLTLALNLANPIIK